jgi:surface antigen
MGNELRMTALAAAMLWLGGCESLPDDAFGGMGGVFGEVMDRSANTASVKMIRDAADSMCSSDNTMCQNLTVSALSGFTEAFVDQLTQTDVRRINDARERSIATGEDQSWKNPDTGASGRVSSEPAEQRPPEPTPVKVKKDRLQTLPTMEAVGERFVVNAGGGANGRGGPGTSYGVVDRLEAQEQVQGISKVVDEEWYLVGRDSVGIGYVFGELLQKWTPPAGEPLDEALETTQAPPAEDVDEVSIDMASDCFTTTQSVTLASGDTEEATVTSCRTPDGWVTV